VLIAALPALSCRLGSFPAGRDEVFQFWGQTFALVPGLPGKYLRKCYYCLTLRACSLDCEIGFLAYFNHRGAEVGRGVYVGPAACIGEASLGDGALIGTRAGILNGGRQHRFGADGKLTACDPKSLRRVRVGPGSWVGEAAIVMADVGSRCVIAAGAVVSNPVPDGCIVGGNPARFVGKVTESVAVGSPPNVETAS
jgi:acetyltransferase-like isoleucine patch superfamily enzyme